MATALDPFVAVLLGPDEERRQIALRYAQEQGTPPVLRLLVEQLAAALHRDDAQVRQRAREALASIGQAAVPSLIHELSWCQDPAHRLQLAEALAAIGPVLEAAKWPGLFCTLGVSLTLEPDEAVRAALMQAILRMRAVDSLPGPTKGSAASAGPGSPPLADSD
jgi:hypothetical protein